MYREQGRRPKRITSALNRLSKYGITTIATATEVQNPKYRAQGAYIQAGPSFQGKEYPSQLMGYFDVIGRLIEPGS
jgi:hypothetical protein